MNQFKRLNNIGGWAVFIVALITYTLTVERTASFWDCGEFIACAFKLQVPHPPGAPFFLLLGRLFSMLAMGNVTEVAYWVNMLSVVASAFTILFLFWSITLFGRKILDKPAADLSQSEIYLLLGSACIGSLIFTFSDTFWFSAVEAEVYAMSSFLVALLVWMGLKWELIEDEKSANRWLILIAYIIGLSIGVHLMNILTVPALALLYYFKKYPNPTYKGGIWAIFLGFVVLQIINSGIIPGLPSMAGKSEIFFVNTFGLPYGFGVGIFLIAFFGALVAGIWYSEKKKKMLLNIIMLSFTFILIGYASYITALVRANFNPPINENAPKDILSYVSYLKREQYGDRDLLFGPVYTAQPVDQERGTPLYRKLNGKYEVYDYRPEYVWEKGQKMLLPRLWSREPGHVKLYQEMLGIPQGQKPTMWQNLRFMFTYQMGSLYMRYFLWNFVGRESDIQGATSVLPWETKAGKPFAIQASKAFNNYFMLPLILGLLGFLYQLQKGEKDLLVISIIFLLTGLGLVVFLNSPPTEPRERDYIYVASYYIFAIWVGLGVMQLYEWLQTIIKNTTTRSVGLSVVLLVVPAIMLQQNWDDHNRNHRYHSVDFAKNLLNSCAKDAILFTGGDNDTFPLWYVQEVEGFRTDVRVCNLSLLGTDWYIQQMKRRTYLSDSLPVSLGYNQFIQGKNDQVPFYENPNVKGGINIKEFVKLIKDENPAIQVPLQSGDMINILPSGSLFLPINIAAVKQQGFVPKALESLVADTIAWKYGNNDMYKPDLIQLDMIANNDWKRPIYFSSTLATSNYLGLREFMQVEGLAYRLMPFKVPGAKEGFVNSDIMYDNLMNKMFWRGMDNPQANYNEFYTGSPVISSRIAFLRLAEQLIREDKKEKAKTALNYCMKILPDKAVPYDQISVSFIDPLLKVGETKIALVMAQTLVQRCDENLAYYLDQQNRDSQTINTNLYMLNMVVTQLKDNNQEALSKKYGAIFEKYYKRAENG